MEWSCLQFLFWCEYKWNSIWFQNTRKFVCTILFHLIKQEKGILFISKPNFMWFCLQYYSFFHDQTEPQLILSKRNIVNTITILKICQKKKGKYIPSQQRYWKRPNNSAIKTQSDLFTTSWEQGSALWKCAPRPSQVPP